MRIKRFLTINNLAILAGFACLVYILILRFQVGLIRFFDEDEFTHMFRSYLISAGKIPYKDFGYFYSPIFAMLFAPFFAIFKDQIAVVFLSRSLAFLIFLAGVVAIFFLGKKLANIRTGLLAAFLWSFLPLAFDKTLEIRPDNLAIVFWLISLVFLVYFRHFFAGLFFGLALATIIKIAFVYPGFAIFFLFSLKKDFNKSLKNIVVFHLGMILPVAILLLFFLPFGTFTQAFYSIFIMPLEVSQAYGTRYFVPYFPFSPNDAFYGVAGKSLPWFLSNLVLVLGVIGIVRSRLKWFFLPSFLSLTTALLYLYRVTLVQYYLPVLILAVLGTAELFGDLFELIRRRAKFVFILFWLVFFGVLTYGFRQSALAHFRWGNDYQVGLVATVLNNSQPGDYFFDGTGYHLFRPSGYYLCCEFFGDWVNKLSQPLPNFQDQLRSTQTKFIFQIPRLGRLTKDNKVFLEENYFPTRVKDLYAVGKKLLLSSGEVNFEILAAGNYTVQRTDRRSLVIDGLKLTGSRIYLANGFHTIKGTGEVLLLYEQYF